MKKYQSVLLCFMVLLLTSLTWADFVKEEPAWEPPINDVCPNIGPIAPFPPVDLQWDLLWYFNAQAACQDNQLLGVEYANNMFWITGGNNATDPNQMYRLTPTGVIVDSAFQPAAATGWGIRDLAYDGSYVYGGCEATTIFAFDQVTGANVPSMNIPRPAGNTCVRALAYDPATDHFWTGNFAANIIEFDRSGAVVWSGPPPTGVAAIYGMFWDDADPAGPWLWIYDQSPSGSNSCTFFQYNPITHTTTGISHLIQMIPGSTAQIAGGCGFTNEYNPTFWTIVGMTQGTPNDMLFVLEMYPNASGYAPAAPTNFTVSNNGAALIASLNWTLPTTTINGNPLNPNYPITAVQINRNGSPLVTLPPTAVSFNDNVPAAGSYNYAVFCVNDSGNGISATAGAWIGLDVPAAPTNVTATVAGLQVNIAWTAPTQGMHNGYFPPGSWQGQKIYRNGTLLTTLLGTNTTYTDTPPVEGDYVYGVAYYNSSGEGPAGNAPSVHAGPVAFIATPTPYNWIEINPAHPGALPGTNTGLASDDQNLGPFNLGFSFNFYGNTFNAFRVCTNGFATFTSTATVYTNVTIPNTAEPNNLLAVYWDDMNFTTYGSAWYYYDAPSNRCIIEWDSVAHYGVTPPGSYTFEIILYAAGYIDYMYKALTPGTANSATVGIENASGTVGVLCYFDGAGPIPPTPQSGIRFASPTAPDLDITLVPFIYPIQIPAQGGYFDFYCFVANNGTLPVVADLWIAEMQPDSSIISPMMGPAHVTLIPGTRGWYRRQYVPGSAMPGQYLYMAKGGIYPNTIYAEDSFVFTKLTTGDGPWISGWLNTGDPLTDECTVTAQPSTYDLRPAYPNPFNPTTTISFTLANAGITKLAVFDISGREVATLVNGYRDAGSHSVTFDASKLTSGIYVYRLTSGEFNASGKMVLMK